MQHLDWGPVSPAGAAPAVGGRIVVTDGIGVVATYRAAERGGAEVVLEDGTSAEVVRPGRVVARAGWSRRVLRGRGGDLAGLEVGPGGQGTAWRMDGRRLALQRVGDTWVVVAPEVGVVLRVSAQSIELVLGTHGDLVPLAVLLVDLVLVPSDSTRTWCAPGAPPVGRRTVLDG